MIKPQEQQTSDETNVGAGFVGTTFKANVIKKKLTTAKSNIKLQAKYK